MASVQLAITMKQGECPKLTPALTSAGIPMLQNRPRYNLKIPTEKYTLFSGQNVTLVLYHPPVNADLSFHRQRQKKSVELTLAGEMC